MNKNRLSQLFSPLRILFAYLFGNISYSCPPWLIVLGKMARSRPVVFWSLALLFFTLMIGGSLRYQWYTHQPKPPVITASITAPKVTPISEDGLYPYDLTIDFGITQPDTGFVAQSVAPLSDIGKEVSEGVRITPAIEGTWSWDSDSRLRFTPKNDWPAGITYDIAFDKTFFAPGKMPQPLTYRFSTAPFAAEITAFTFYQDPTHPKIQQALATVAFNFPVDPSSFEQHLTLMLQALQDKHASINEPHYQYTVTYDKFKRTAYLQSQPIAPTQIPRYLQLAVGKGVKAAVGPGESTQAVDKNLLIPDLHSFFKVTNAIASIIRNQQDQPGQVLSLETSLGVTEREMSKHLHVYVLPKNYPAIGSEQEKPDYQWQNPGEVTPKILALAKPLAMKTIPAEDNYATLHHYQFNAQSPQYLYLKLDKGTQGFGDFVLNDDYMAVILIPAYPQEINFIHPGALLALNNEQKLSVLVRGLPAVKFDFARIRPENVNQLITQTEGDFNNPLFLNQSFNQQDISEVFSEIQPFDGADPSKQQYTALDFSKYLATTANTTGPRGLFLLQATGYDPTNNTLMDVHANRLILMTDLALVVKDNQDGSHDLFVESITQGTPVAGASVSVLGKNGLPVVTATTDPSGRAAFPTLKDYINEREPVVYLASAGTDVSFIPYNNSNRQLNYSRYDVGGIFNNTQDTTSLTAYLFSDRGIYRPGDMVHLGMIVKQVFAHPQPSGVVVEATISDPRGAVVSDEKFTLDDLGYLTLDYQTNAASPTGQYYVSLYLVKDDRTDSLLGSTNFRVSEFQPDRMRIQSSFSVPTSAGWVSPTDLKAKVMLWNLYGTPAADRRIGGRLLLQPRQVTFAAYPDFVFVDPLVDPKKPAKVLTDDLPETKTDAQGNAEFALNLQRFDKATYQLTFSAEGFEADGGRSVATQLSTLVSPLAYFVGYKPDGDLNYIQQNASRNLNFIAIDPSLKQISVQHLKLTLSALQPVSTLVKNPNGSFQYQSIIQSKVLQTSNFSVTAEGLNYALPTNQIGDFAIAITDENNVALSNVKFSIVGNSQQPLAKNAELSVKLSSENYKAGDDIELQISAPYTGAGLITIERDKVYAVQWFKTDTTSSVQKIHIPENFEGNGYVNVAFVRDWNSPDIFISPLSYTIVPFSVNHDAASMNIDLQVPPLARPGEPYVMHYHTDKPGKIIVFAVDEGILQVAHYETPEPLGFFFQKRALEVVTQQTVDQILPQYIRGRELSAVGGDDGESMLSKYLNPFKRKTDLPVAFWSGIVDTDGSDHTLTYDIPPYFNGSLHVMAVAVGASVVGAADKQSEVRGYFVINPNVPTFVAPGDEFEISASIANNVKGSGAAAKVSVKLTATAEVEILDSSERTLVIPEGQEKTVKYTLRALTNLGAAQLNFTAAIGSQSSDMDASLSVRPATQQVTTIQSGQSQDPALVLPLDRVLYPEQRDVAASMSTSPMLLVSGIQRFLDHFPYGCTEQLTSQALPLLALSGQPWEKQDLASIQTKIMAVIQMLGSRQMSNGGFSYWPGLMDNTSNTFASVYAMHFLTEAKSKGYEIPADQYSLGLAYLKEIAAKNPTDLDSARIQAYAIYLLTRNEIVTTNYLTNVQLYLDKENPETWKKGLTGAYIAATYQLLKNDAQADALIAQYQSDAKTGDAINDFYDLPIANAQYLYLIEHHFPNRLPQIGPTLVKQLVAAINSDEMNTLMSAYISIALSGYASETPQKNQAGFSISELRAQGQKAVLATFGQSYGDANIGDDAKQVEFSNPNKLPYFYQLTQTGFDTLVPKTPLKQGIEVVREYRDAQGNVVDHVALGAELEVHIQIRALDDRYLTNIAIIDLLPGGFEVIRDSVKSDYLDYSDIREDRVILFTGVGTDAKEIVYRIKATNPGHYLAPAVYAESMYDPSITANGIAGTMGVTKNDL